MKYVTMTTGGLKGAVYEADNDLQAESKAKADGYDVLDIVDFGAGEGEDLVLVVKG